MKTYKTTSSQQTKKLAGELAKKFLKKQPRKRALIFALSGELGAGKTTFIQGFLRCLGIRKKITSPTFILMKRFTLNAARLKRFKHAYHIDCYRIHKAKEFADLGLKEILKNPQNIILIEWPERIKNLLPKNTVWLKFQHGAKENERTINLNS